MTPLQLSDFYADYIAILNAQDWARLGDVVQDDVAHNGRLLGLAGYRAMLENDFRAIPDLKFTVTQVVSQPPSLAARLHFDCTPAGVLFGLPVHGQRVVFDENVFYDLDNGKIRWVWSVIDKAAIAAQI